MDIANELRRFIPKTGPLSDAHHAMLEGANEIESLTAERDRLSTALTKIVAEIAICYVEGDTSEGLMRLARKSASLLQKQELDRLASKGIHFDD